MARRRRATEAAAPQGLLDRLPLNARARGPTCGSPGCSSWR